MPAGITVVGLGPGDPALLTRQAWEALSGGKEVYLRTAQHPAVSCLPATLRLHSFDELYQASPDYSAVYQGIVDKVFELGQQPQGVIYAVPGDPTVGEATVQMLAMRAADSGLRFEVFHGVSFVEPCLALLGYDALDGLSIADALDLAHRHHPPFPPDAPSLIGQLYSRLVASEVKLTLMNQYPDDHQVWLIHGAGTSQAATEHVPLSDIDRSENIGSLTSLFVPPLEQVSAFESFQDTVARLRAPDGCPWDREQTHRSLRPHFLEEAYEVLHVLDIEEYSSLAEELGDMLLQIVLQAQIATESGEFSMADVLASINEKIVRRHPHVFAGLQVKDVEHVLHNWEALKAGERQAQEREEGVLDGVPRALPALEQAWEIQARVARVGFDWPQIEGVWAKVQEELAELQAAADEKTKAAEIGDLLFAVVNYARWLGVDPEAALREGNVRFRQRFAAIEAAARLQGRPLADMSIDELEALWQVAKKGGPPRDQT